MSRSPSDATLLRQSRSEAKRWKGRWESTQTELNQYRARATKAEQESAEWRKRFDQLLEVTRQPRNGNNGGDQRG